MNARNEWAKQICEMYGQGEYVKGMGEMKEWKK